MSRRAPAAVCLALSSCACAAPPPPPEETVVTQRPFLSSDTATAPVGALELEAGVDRVEEGPWRFPFAVKTGLGPATELFAGAGHLDDDDGESGLADPELGLRRRLAEASGARPAVAAQGRWVLPAGAGDVSGGEHEVHLAAIATWDVDGAPLTLFYELGLLGEDGADGADVQHGVALAGARALGGPVGAFAELARVATPERGEEASFATVGLTWQLAGWTVADLGLSVGLEGDAPDLLVHLGVTTLLGLRAR